MAGQARCEDSLIADRAVREDQHHLGVAQRDVCEAVGDRRHAAPRVDQNRDLGFPGQGKDRVHPGTVERKGLGTWMQLDAARPRRQAALALGCRFFGWVQSAEGEQSAFAFASPSEHAVVGHAIGGTALGVVQREDAGPACARVVQEREQLWEGERAPVLVEAEMRVGIEDLGLSGPQAGHLGQEWGQGVGVQRGGVHEPHNIHWPFDSYHGRPGLGAI